MPGRTRPNLGGDPDWEQFAQHVLDELVPMVDESAYCVNIVPKRPEDYNDVQWCVELGLMIMLDKPIIAVVRPGTKVPNKLALVADKIVELDFDDPSFKSRMLTALSEVTAELGLEEPDGHSEGEEGSAPGDDEAQPG